MSSKTLIGAGAKLEVKKSTETTYTTILGAGDITPAGQEYSTEESGKVFITQKFKEKIKTLVTTGSGTFTVYPEDNDLGVAVLEEAYTSPDNYDIKLTYADESTDTWKALVTSFPRPNVVVDGLLTRECTMEYNAIIEHAEAEEEEE